jgi:hypothetical protein
MKYDAKFNKGMLVQFAIGQQVSHDIDTLQQLNQTVRKLS